MDPAGFPRQVGKNGTAPRVPIVMVFASTAVRQPGRFRREFAGHGAQVRKHLDQQRLNLVSSTWCFALERAPGVEGDVAVLGQPN